MKKLIALFAVVVLMTSISFAQTTNTVTLTVNCPGPTLVAASNTESVTITAPGTATKSETYTVNGWGLDGKWTWTAVYAPAATKGIPDAWLTGTNTGTVSYENTACNASKTFTHGFTVTVPVDAVKDVYTGTFTITVAD
jgi:hypothetical protein